MLRVSVVAVVLAIGISAAVAAGNKPAGDLDPWFGNHGRVLLRPSQDSGASDLAVQPDGKVVIAGSISERRPPPSTSISDFLVLLLNRTAPLDSSFCRAKPTSLSRDTCRQGRPTRASPGTGS